VFTARYGLSPYKRWSKSICAPDDYNTESYTSFLSQYLAQSDCLAADRQGQEDTRLTLTPSVIPNSNYVVMVSDWKCLKYFFVLFCTVIIRCTETFWSSCMTQIRFVIKRLMKSLSVTLVVEFFVALCVFGEVGYRRKLSCRKLNPKMHRNSIWNLIICTKAYSGTWLYQNVFVSKQQ
jgi:hypothetical protein